MREVISIFDCSGIKSSQINTKRRDPSFFLTNTTALAQGLLEHLIAPLESFLLDGS